MSKVHPTAGALEASDDVRTTSLSGSMFLIQLTLYSGVDSRFCSVTVDVRYVSLTAKPVDIATFTAGVVLYLTVPTHAADSLDVVDVSITTVGVIC